MKFDKAKDPAACAAKVSTRYAVHGVAVVRKDDATFLASTDGRALAMVRAYPEDGDDAPASSSDAVYPCPAFTAARKACKRKAEASLVLNGSAVVATDEGTRTEFAKIPERFPDVLGVLPKAKPVHVLRLNADFLARLQKGFGANAVAIEVHALDDKGQLAHDLPLTIRPLYMDGPGTDDGSFGVLMPIMEGS